jgi:hypothetical protein
MLNARRCMQDMHTWGNVSSSSIGHQYVKDTNKALLG